MKRTLLNQERENLSFICSFFFSFLFFSLAATLNKIKGDVWREELPDYTDDELYLKFIRMKDESTGDNFDWYRIRGNQLYMDGCYILAIRCYTICAELKPAATLPFLNRAACYYKVFEVS